MILKITEVRLLPFGQEPAKSEMQGDFNLLNPIFLEHLKKLDKKKESYFYIYELDAKIEYKFNLVNSEYDSYKKIYNI